jgi:UDP-N-acetylmuramate dehydrogenase
MRQIMSDNLAWRIAKQPQLDEFASCGSVFKKIEGVGAGRLIDEAGLKGKTIGGAQVSPKHANYLVNLGNATAGDVKELIETVQKKVKSKTGYLLEPELEIIEA